MFTNVKIATITCFRLSRKSAFEFIVEISIRIHVQSLMAFTVINVIVTNGPSNPKQRLFQAHKQVPRCERWERDPASALRSRGKGASGPEPHSDHGAKLSFLYREYESRIQL